MREGGVQIIECGLQVDESADTAPVSLGQLRDPCPLEIQEHIFSHRYRCSNRLIGGPSGKADRCLPFRGLLALRMASIEAASAQSTAGRASPTLPDGTDAEISNGL
jgi:hypothetical protein